MGGLQEPGPPVVLPYTRVEGRTTGVFGLQCYGPFTLKGRDGTGIDFVCLTMTDPASSWFEVVELPVTTNVVIPSASKGQMGTKIHNNNKLRHLTNHLQ